MKNLQSKKISDSIHHDARKRQSEVQGAGGQGARVQCVFVHGWAMNSAVWSALIEELPNYIEPICLDLPGHGQFNLQDFATLQDLVTHLQQLAQPKLTGPAIWIGWSLGALPVLQLAEQRPDLVKKVLLIASNPCFVKRENWDAAVAAEVFDQFAANLQANLDKTIQRFLSLQVQGMAESREVLRQLRLAIASQGQSSDSALSAGLNVLKTVDLRQQIKTLPVPQCWLLGAKDGLVPAVLNDYLNVQPGVKSHIISGSAHLPFVSHVADVVEQLTDFIHD